MSRGRNHGRASARRRQKSRVRRLRPTSARALYTALAHYTRRFDEGHWWPMGTNRLWMEIDPCVYCGDSHARTWDHIDPMSHGYNKVENLARACQLCNKYKSGTPLLRYLVDRAHRRVKRGRPDVR